MGQHFIRILDDGELPAEGGWAFVEDEASGDIAFLAERSAVANEEVLNEAWAAAQQLVIEQAVRDGIVQWVKPKRREPDDFSGGRRVAL